jgi:uncharacterized protein (DUF885 family)
MAVAPQWFRRLPKAELEVRAVEEWRQETAPVAFYNRPSEDGSRPGIYYVNLADMTQVLKPQIEAISYHEGAPGHHFQIALRRSFPTFPSSAASAAMAPIPKAGASIPRASARRWASTRTR